MLLGVAQVEFELQAQTVIVHQLFPPQGQRAAKQNDLSDFLRLRMGLHEEHGLARCPELLRQKAALIILPAELACRLRLWPVFGRQVFIIQPRALLLVWAAATVGAFVWLIQRGIFAQLGNHRQVVCARQQDGLRGAEMSVQGHLFHAHKHPDHLP